MKRIVYVVGLLLAIPLPVHAMLPLNAALIVQSAEVLFYRNFPSTYTFDGFLNEESNPNLAPYKIGSTFPNGQAAYSIPGLSLGNCLLKTTQSWGNMIGLLLINAGPPYGPNQTYGGCRDTSGNPPTPINRNQITACDSPYNGGHNFAVTHVNSIAKSSVVSEVPGATCYACGQGPYWYPCQAGLLGCANPPVPGSCTPTHF